VLAPGSRDESNQENPARGRGTRIRLLLASSNPNKLNEFRVLAAAFPTQIPLDLELLPNFSQLPLFEESAPTFAENAAGKALHYSRFAELPVIADDSGLAVDALGGAPGVLSARYAGPNASSAERISKLLAELRAARSTDRHARFVCVLALAIRGRIVAVFSDAVEGEILSAPRGTSGFGYDPVFFFGPLGKSFAEIPAGEKNRYSHRGKAFRRLAEFLVSSPVL
jgi:XTP/dITP diphosphohydrolase